MLFALALTLRVVFRVTMVFVFVLAHTASTTGGPITITLLVEEAPRIAGGGRSSAPTPSVPAVFFAQVFGGVAAARVAVILVSTDAAAGQTAN